LLVWCLATSGLRGAIRAFGDLVASLAGARLTGTALAATAATAAAPSRTASGAVFVAAVLLRLARFGRLTGYIRRLEHQDRRLKCRSRHPLRSAAAAGGLVGFADGHARHGRYGAAGTARG
jgi:hypothetical protein